MPTPRVHNPLNNALDAQDLADSNLLAAAAAFNAALKADVAAHAAAHVAGVPATVPSFTSQVTAFPPGDAAAFGEVAALMTSWSQATQAALTISDVAGVDVMTFNFPVPR